MPLLRRCMRDAGIPGAQPRSRWQWQSEMWNRSGPYFTNHTANLYWTRRLFSWIYLFCFCSHVEWQMRKLQAQLRAGKRYRRRGDGNCSSTVNGDTWQSFLYNWLLLFEFCGTEFIHSQNDFLNANSFSLSHCNYHILEIKIARLLLSKWVLLKKTNVFLYFSFGLLQDTQPVTLHIHLTTVPHICTK